MAAGTGYAQLMPADPDWREQEAPAPPDFKVDALIRLDMPRSELRYGVDPATVTLASDGIVRYVVVAVGTSGAVNAMYEGIRCDTAQVKVYARSSGSGWNAASGSTWRPLHEGQRHSLQIARTGACAGHSPNRSATQIVRDLRAPADTRYYIN